MTVSLKQLIQAFTYPKIPSQMDLFLKKPTLRAENANLFTVVITITPTDEKSSSYTETIFMVEGNSQLEFNIANLRATDTEFQTSESTNVTHESIF